MRDVGGRAGGWGGQRIDGKVAQLQERNEERGDSGDFIPSLGSSLGLGWSFFGLCLVRSGRVSG